MEASFEVWASVLQSREAATTTWEVRPQVGVAPEEGVARAWPGTLPPRPRASDLWTSGFISIVPASLRG